MNKNLLTVAWILSLLVVNQAFGWEVPIKNDTTNSYWVKATFNTISSGDCSPAQSFQLNAGATISIITQESNRCGLNVRIANTRKETNVLRKIIAGYGTPKIMNSGTFIIPLKGLTIKTGSDGQTVIVENQ